MGQHPQTQSTYASVYKLLTAHICLFAGMVDEVFSFLTGRIENSLRELLDTGRAAQQLWYGTEHMRSAHSLGGRPFCWVSWWFVLHSAVLCCCDLLQHCRLGTKLCWRV
jgi:hypothetical protein